VEKFPSAGNSYQAWTSLMPSISFIFNDPPLAWGVH
jgi:hypothetical protein